MGSLFTGHNQRIAEDIVREVVGLVSSLAKATTARAGPLLDEAQVRSLRGGGINRILFTLEGELEGGHDHHCHYTVRNPTDQPSQRALSSNEHNSSIPILNLTLNPNPTARNLSTQCCLERRPTVRARALGVALYRGRALAPQRGSDACGEPRRPKQPAAG